MKILYITFIIIKYYLISRCWRGGSRCEGQFFFIVPFQIYLIQLSHRCKCVFICNILILAHLSYYHPIGTGHKLLIFFSLVLEILLLIFYTEIPFYLPMEVFLYYVNINTSALYLFASDSRPHISVYFEYWDLLYIGY